MKRVYPACAFFAFLLPALFSGPGRAWPQAATHLSIATGATGGVYYPLGRGMAAVISRHLPGAEATAEVTAASVDNMKLLHAERVALALTLPDTAWEAYQGRLKGMSERVGVRALLSLYSNYMHVAALEESGIRAIADLKGKRVSTGAPGSGTEIKALRVMEAYGLSPADLKSRERLGVSESAGALKEGKIDAFFWDGGLPTAAIADLAASPGLRLRLIPHGDAVARMAARHGPFYFAGTIPKGVYKQIDDNVPVAAVTNLLVASARMEEGLAYSITRLLLERTVDLVAAHPAAGEIALQSAAVGSPVPFHPGALRYFKENGINVPAAR